METVRHMSNKFVCLCSELGRSRVHKGTCIHTDCISQGDQTGYTPNCESQKVIHSQQPQLLNLVMYVTHVRKW